MELLGRYLVKRMIRKEKLPKREGKITGSKKKWNSIKETLLSL